MVERGEIVDGKTVLLLRLAQAAGRASRCRAGRRGALASHAVSAPETPFADAVDAFLREAPTSFSTPGPQAQPRADRRRPAARERRADARRRRRPARRQAHPRARRGAGRDGVRRRPLPLLGQRLDAPQPGALPGGRRRGRAGDRVALLAQVGRRRARALGLAARLGRARPSTRRAASRSAIPSRRSRPRSRPSRTRAPILLVEPSWLGVVSHVERIAELAHARGIPLICDQAWAGHFGFHPDVPASALALGADAVAISTHKALTSFTPGAVLLARDTRLPRPRPPRRRLRRARDDEPLGEPVRLDRPLPRAARGARPRAARRRARPRGAGARADRRDRRRAAARRQRARARRRSARATRSS